jgi:hypothetical protein
VLRQVSCKGITGPVVLGLCLFELHALGKDELEGVTSAETGRVGVRNVHGDA